MKTSSSFWTTVEEDDTGGTYRAEITTDLLDFQFLLTSNRLSKESGIKVWVSGVLCKSFEDVPYSDDQVSEQLFIIAHMLILKYELSKTIANELDELRETETDKINKLRADTTNKKEQNATKTD